MRTRVAVLILLLVIVVFAARLTLSSTPKFSLTPTAGSQVPASSGEVLAARTKTTNCEIRGPLQDTACTPGAVIATATRTQICTPGYAKLVRNVGSTEKSQVYDEYGITHHQPGQYEVDHLVSLELGGSNDISNLWPEAANPTPGFHQKDVVENYLHTQVCQGTMSLAQAQSQIAGNWMSVYQTLAR